MAGYGPAAAMMGAGGASAPPAASSDQLGVPQGGVAPTGAEQAPDAGALSELVRMLRGGQVGAEKFLQLLSLLASQTNPQMDQAPQGAPQEPQGPGGPAGPGGGPMDIASLMGGMGQ